MNFKSFLRVIETVLFIASIILIVLWGVLSIFNYSEGWELPVLLPLLYCVLKLRRISSDNEKIKKVLEIDSFKESKTN